MALVWRNYNFRIYPTKEQEESLDQLFSCTRFVYNHYVEVGKRVFESEGRYPTYQENLSALALLVSQNPFLQQTDRESLPLAIHNLSRAYANHVNKKDYRPPRFKSKNDGHQSYMTRYIKGSKLIANGKINLPAVGAVPIVVHRSIARYFRPFYITVIRKPSLTYEVSLALYAPDHLYQQDATRRFAVDGRKTVMENGDASVDGRKNIMKNMENGDVSANVVANTDIRSIGLDFSMPDLLIDSEGHSARYPHYYKQLLQRLSKEQRKLAHCQRGSHNYQKQRVHTARMMQKCASQRIDFQHKLSRQISDQYDLVCIEDLAIKQLITNTKFGKSAYDDSWYHFVQMMEYKLNESDGHLQRVGRWFPSSRLCSRCGQIKQQLSLDERIYHCSCGFTESRDVNAAINIKKEGERLYRLGATIMH